jgi:hypothetical protein
MISKLVFVYDSTVKPFGDIDIDAVKRLLDKIRGAGIKWESLDTRDMPSADLDRWRERATIIAVWKHVRVRQPFGSRRGGGLPYLGKRVPALFVYEEGKDEPLDVYPHEKGSEQCSILEYLNGLVQT